MEKRRSPGCKRGNPEQPGKLLFNSMQWTEKGLPSVERLFYLDIPTSYRQTQPTPLVFIFHGWGDNATDYHAWGFGELAEKEQFIAVYPSGLADCQEGAACNGTTSWHGVGSTSSASCDARHQTRDFCYESCQTLGRCNNCSWTTCYNDIGFVERLWDLLAERFCLDEQQVYAYGCSNGGMFVHQLAQSLPSRFRAVASGCGGKPHRGFEELPHGPPVSLLLVTGRDDKTIPPSTPTADTGWWDGFFYASTGEVVQAYKRHNKCRNKAPRPYPMDYTANNMACVQQGYDCLDASRVVTCSFNGGHDLNLGFGNDSVQDEPQLVWQFFKSHRNGHLQKLTLASVYMHNEGPSQTLRPFWPAAMSAAFICLVISLVFGIRAKDKKCLQYRYVCLPPSPAWQWRQMSFRLRPRLIQADQF